MRFETGMHRASFMGPGPVTGRQTAHPSGVF